MNAHVLKKILAVCIVLAVSGAAWACGDKGGDKDKSSTSTVIANAQYLGGGCGGGTCGDKDKKDAAAFSDQAQYLGGGCGGSDDGTKDCPKK